MFAVLLLFWAQPAIAQIADITLKDGNICRGGEIDLSTLIVEYPPDVPYSRWKEGNSYLNVSGFSCKVSPTTPTVYTLEYALSAHGSTFTQDATVTMLPVAINPAEMPAFQHDTYYDFRFSAENALLPVTYVIEGNLPRGLTSYPDGSIIGYPLLSGNRYHDYPLSVTVRDAGGCTASHIYILSPAWQAPNAFIPGSSGNNSIFLSSYQLEIYDRRGDLVHKGLGWTGVDANGRRAPAGTYFYKVIISQPDKTVRYFSGFITVLPQK
jgi:hypothetical protein